MRKSKSWLTAVPFFFLAWVAEAQEFSLGVKLGASYPSIQNFDFTNEDGLDGLGIHGGIMSEYKVGPFAGIAEVLYDYNQFSGTVSGFQNDYYYSRLVLPVAFKFYVTQGLNLQLGGRFGLLLTAEQETTVELQPIVRYDISLTTSSTDFGAFFGVGYDSPIGLAFSLTYNAQVTDFPSDGEQLSGPMLSVGYYIFHTGGTQMGIPTQKGRKWKPGRTRSGR